MPLPVRRRLVEHFVAGAPARVAAELVGVHRNGAILFHREPREVIRAREARSFGGEVEMDESCFGGRRKKGSPGRGAAGKVPVFSLLKRGGRVHAVMIPDVCGATLPPITRRRVRPDAAVYSDGYWSCDVLDVSRLRHVRIDKRRGFALGRAGARADRGRPRRAHPAGRGFSSCRRPGPSRWGRRAAGARRRGRCRSPALGWPR